jgi:ribosomal protein L25 (general stress protein Ctc)
LARVRIGSDKQTDSIREANMTRGSFQHGAASRVRRSGEFPRYRTGADTRPVLTAAKRAGGDLRENKLNALVQLDVEGSGARIEIRGSVDTRNVKAIYILAKRANAMAPGADIVLDLQRATVQQKVMDKLWECAQARQLPLQVDPKQSECRLHITPAAKLTRTSVGLTLAA